MSAEAATSTQQPASAPWWPAIGVHVGLLLVCASCAYTLQPLMFSSRQWIAFAALGLVVVCISVFRLGRAAASKAGRLLLALGVATAAWLGYEPLLADLPGLSAAMPDQLAQFEPGVVLPGIAIAFIFWLLYRATARGGIASDVPFRGALLASAGLTLALTAIMYLALHNLYDLQGGFSTLILTFRVIQYTALVLVALEMSGAVGVGGLAHIYVGTALIIAAARNLLA